MEKIEKANKEDVEKLRQSIFNPNQQKEDTEKSKGQDMAEMIHAWLDKKYIHSKTRLNGNQVIALTILKTLCDKYGVTCLKELIDNFVTYKLSEGGESSKELVEMIKAQNEKPEDDELMKRIEPFLK